MKKTLFLLAAAAVAAQAEEDLLTLPLPESVNIAKADAIANVCKSYNAGTLLTTISAKEAGIYIGFNNGNISNNWGSNGEGTWTNTNNTGSITLAGRYGADGESFGIVVAGNSISGLETGTHITALTFSFDIPTFDGTSGTQNYKYALGVYNADGEVVTKTVSADYPVTSSSAPATLSLSVNDFDWSSDYKVVAVVKGVAGTATSTYTISNIKLTAVPEPATATLSLLALAGLAARRKRH